MAEQIRSSREIVVRQLIAYLRLLHGAFNLGVAIFFVYQGLSGLRIRRERAAGVMSPSLIRKHRSAGPVLTVLGLFGFISGVTIVVMHFGVLIKYFVHFVTGLALVSCLAATYLISGRIKVHAPDWRTLHFAFGLCVLGLYAVQVFLGLGILF